MTGVSKTDLDVIRLMLAGASLTGIARRLGLSEATAEERVHRALRRIDCASSASQPRERIDG